MRRSAAELGRSKCFTSKCSSKSNKKRSCICFTKLLKSTLYNTFLKLNDIFPIKRVSTNSFCPGESTFRWVRFDNTYKAQGWTSLPPIIRRWKELLRRRHTLSAQLNWSHNHLTTGSFTYLLQQKILAWPKPRHIEMFAVYINTIHLATSFLPQHLRQFLLHLLCSQRRLNLARHLLRAPWLWER